MNNLLSVYRGLVDVGSELGHSLKVFGVLGVDTAQFGLFFGQLFGLLAPPLVGILFDGPQLSQVELRHLQLRGLELQLGRQRLDRFVLRRHLRAEFCYLLPEIFRRLPGPVEVSTNRSELSPGFGFQLGPNLGLDVLET